MRYKKGTTFLDRFKKNYIPEPNSGCWIWIGATAHKGYGTIRSDIKPFKPMGAHRASWILHNGPIGDGLHVLHKCDIAACVNPKHLFLGTHKENMKDMILKNRGRGSIEYCKRGHEFNIHNTHIYKRLDGISQRICRKCENIRCAKKRAARRQLF